MGILSAMVGMPIKQVLELSDDHFQALARSRSIDDAYVRQRVLQHKSARKTEIDLNQGLERRRAGVLNVRKNAAFRASDSRRGIVRENSVLLLTNGPAEDPDATQPQVAAAQMDMSEESGPNHKTIGSKMAYRRYRRRGYRRRGYGGYSRRSSRSGVSYNTVKRMLYKSKYPSSEYAHVRIPRGGEIATSMGLTAGAKYKDVSAEEQALRKSIGWRGRGAYSFGKNFRKLSQGLGLTKRANQLMDMGMSKLSGMGLYGGQGAYSDNALILGGRAGVSGGFMGDETDTLTISETEFVKDIFAPYVASGSSGFAQQTIEVNPGLQSFAPNLAQIACNFTECEWKQLVFELRPVISESNVNNGQTGTAMMVFNYDPSMGSPYDNKEDVMQAHGSVSGRIVDTIRCGVECDPVKAKETEFFVRTGPVPYGRDADQYDLGSLIVATNNIPAAFSNTQLYELWVTYTVDLRKRKAGGMRLNNQQKDWFVCNQDVGYTNVFTSAFISGASGVLASQQNNIGGALSSPAGGQLSYVFPPDMNGVFEVRIFVEGTSMATSGSGTLTVNPGCNISLVTDLYASTQSATDLPASFISNGGTNHQIFIAHIRVRSVTGGVNNSFTIDLKPSAGQTSQWSFEVQEYTMNHFTKPNNPKPVLINLVDNQVYVPS